MPYREDPLALATARRGAHLPLLERVTVAAPCPVPWDDMIGDDRVRHCAQCDQQVYNTIAMTTAEVEALVAEVVAGARVCGRLYRRPDGTLMTRDCVDARRARARAAQRLVAVSSLAAIAAAGITLAFVAQPSPEASIEADEVAFAPEPVCVTGVDPPTWSEDVMPAPLPALDSCASSDHGCADARPRPQPLPRVSSPLPRPSRVTYTPRHLSVTAGGMVMVAPISIPRVSADDE